MNRIVRAAIAALSLPALLLAQASESPLARLRVDKGKVGWDGVDLGMSVVQVERRTGTSLALSRSSSGRCESYKVDVDHHSARLTLGFPSAKPGAKLDSIYVRFSGYQSLAKRAELVAELKKIAPDAVYFAPPAFPDLKEEDAADPTFVLPGGAGYGARIEPGAGLLLGRKECLA